MTYSMMSQRIHDLDNSVQKVKNSIQNRIADEFERFVNETNKKANLLLKEKDPERFKYKYGENSDESALVKQT